MPLTSFLILPTGHNFSTKKTKATFEQPFSEPQISLHLSGLEHATSLGNKILAAIPNSRVILITVFQDVTSKIILNI